MHIKHITAMIDVGYVSVCQSVTGKVRSRKEYTIVARGPIYKTS